MSTNKYMSYNNLSLYDENIKKYIEDNYAKLGETGDVVIDGEIKAENVPHTVSEVTLVTIPAATIQEALTNNVKNITVDTFEHDANTIVYAYYGGKEYASFDNSENYIEFFISNPYVTDGFACSFQKGIDADGNTDATKALFNYRVLDTENITDLVIIQMVVSTIDSKYFDHDMTIINSLSMNRRGDIGTYSTALGGSCVASGQSSFATGLACEATGAFATAVGKGSFATGEAGLSTGLMTTAGREAFANGRQSKATGRGSLATGNSTTASGQYSVAEGQSTTASSSYAHAEGLGSVAKATGAHAEGNYTIAASAYQHTEGQYNIEDAASAYVHIVGNGTSSARSNAHTLDKSGNAWFAGDIYVGSTSGTNKDEGSKKLATEEYANSILQNDIGNYFFIVETIKENGTYYLSGITFEEIIEKFNNGGNMVCHVDGTDYIPLLSVTSSKIIFSGIYNTTSVSLDFDTTGTGVLKTTYLGTRVEVNTAKTDAITEAKSYTDAAIANLVNAAPDELNTLGELATAFTENKDIVDTLNEAIGKKADKSEVSTNLVNGSATGSIRGIATVTEDDSYAIGVNAFAIGNGTKASGKNSFASGQETTASGSYSHVEGYGCTATAAAAHAEGYDTHATARYAHAEGASTTASGNNSHAEGNNTTSSGHYSHAEGNFTTAAGGYSHTEGNYCQTGENATYAHAEGSYAKALATGAHAEGNYVEARAVFSHAEGQNTLASSLYQHVQGKFNVEDANNVYAHIVGNGDADTNRSNAHTIDWSGNAEFAGDVVAYGCSSTGSPISLVSINSAVESLQTEVDDMSEITSEEIQSLFTSV